MALFVWKCERCGKVTKRLLPSRPKLEGCPEMVMWDTGKYESGPQVVRCDYPLKFVTNTASQTMEVIDNGLMAKTVERPVNIEEKIAERNALADKEK